MYTPHMDYSMPNFIRVGQTVRTYISTDQHEELDRSCPALHGHSRSLDSRGGFKAESLLGHITRKASPLRSPPLPSHSLPFPFPPLLRSRPPQIQLGDLGERCKLPSGVWGGAPAEIEFGAF